MTRNLKALGLALVAVFAMSALASSAQAANFTTVDGNAVNLKSENDAAHVFSAGGGSVTCTTTDFIGTAAGPATATQTINADYTGCTALGFINATVTGFDTTEVVGGQTIRTAGRCDYKFNASGTVELICANDEGPVIDAGPCIITIEPTQDLVNAVTYTNLGSGTTADITVDVHATGIKYTIDKGTGIFDEGLCTAALDGNHAIGTTYSDGTYTGSTTIKAFKEAGGAQEGIHVK